MFSILGAARSSLTVSQIGYVSKRLVANRKGLLTGNSSAVPDLPSWKSGIILRPGTPVNSSTQSRPYYSNRESYHNRRSYNWKPNNEKLPLLRPAIWFVVFSSGVLYVCSDLYVRYVEDQRNKHTGSTLFGGFILGKHGSDNRVSEIMDDDRVRLLVNRSHNVNGLSHARTIRFIARLPHWIPFSFKRTAVAAADWWYLLSRAKKCVYTLVGINTVVFGMWHIPRLFPLMMRSFLHDPQANLSYTMLTSTFSHKELVHFAFNNIALISFGTAIASAMGPEQFTAFYLTAGVFSSFASQAFARVFPTLLIPSLGASGAVYGVVGATMLLYPNAPLAIIFIPFVSFPISVLFPAMMGFDLIGLIRRWKGINHVAHLAGGLFGLAYIMWGKDVWTKLVQFQSARHAKKNAGRLN